MYANYGSSSSKRFTVQSPGVGVLRQNLGAAEYVDEKSADLGAKAPPVTYAAVDMERPDSHERANARLDRARERYGKERLWMNGVIDSITEGGDERLVIMVVGFVGILFLLRRRGVI